MKAQWANEVAVILNANAKRVSDKLVTGMRKFVPESQLYISKTLEEGQGLIREILQKNYTHVVLGGGDGTVVEIINQLRKSLAEMGGTDEDMPKLAFLRLGTGNAWSRFMGMDNGKKAMSRMASTDDWRISRFNLLETEKRCAHFAGMGWDANILADYFAIKERLGDSPFSRVFTGIQGYLASMSLRTIPQQMINATPNIRVINQSDEVFEMRHFRPPRLLNIAKGETLYEGPANVFGAATTPYYGYNMVAYPFALTKEGYMNFRVVSAGLWECVSNWHAIFTGGWQSPNLRDYLVQKVSIEVDRLLPVQVGGDLFGHRDKWDLSVSDLSVQVLDLNA
jgi:diacylglycerol kinase family enzyme